MIGRILLDDEDWLVSIGLLGGVKVRLKWRNLTRRALKEERSYLLAMVEELKRAGIPITPESEILRELLRDFSEAIFSRGNARWNVFFLHRSPQEHAREGYIGIKERD